MMLRRLALALLLALWPALAPAQFATIGPTPPSSDNGNRLATTAFVQSAVLSGSIGLASGKIFIGSAGNIATAQTLSGDLTVSIGGVTTFATVNANVGTFGSATQCVTVTNNAKGLTTAISAATCTPAIGSITGLGGGILAALQATVGAAGAPVLFNGAGGTPSSLTLTNATGLPYAALPALSANQVLGALTGTTPSGQSVPNCNSASSALLWAAGAGFGCNTSIAAATVTTNANLTGPVTSVGNATTIGANQVSRANEAQGIARSVVGVTGNATANVADIQGIANQALVVNAAGTALTFGAVNLAAAAAVTGNLPVTNLNGGTNTSATTFWRGDGTWTVPTLASFTNALGGIVSMNNTANFFDGPSVAQGGTGTWFASGTVTVYDTAAGALIFCKLWDGTTLIASGGITTNGASSLGVVPLSGPIASPAGNIRISCKDTTSISGKISQNDAGANSSVVSAFRIN